MITSAAQYAFVDFTNGDLPTAGFDGWIMPRRSDPQCPHAAGMLKAEDVAFLVECTRDKAGAFKGLSFPAYRGGYTPGDTTPASVALTKTISGAQMRDIRSYTTNLISVGLRNPRISGGGLGFLQSPFTEIASVYSTVDDFGAWDTAWAAFAARNFGGTWAATSQAADFASGAPVASAPVLAIFNDAAHLVRPVYALRFGESIAAGTSITIVPGEGTPPSGAGGFGYTMQAPSSVLGTPGYSYHGFYDPFVAARVSRDYLSSANLWIFYMAVNQVHSLDPDGFTMYVNFGFVRLSDYLTPRTTSTEFTWLCNDGLQGFYARLLSDCGWAEYSTSGATFQNIIPLFDCALFVEGTPSGRTQWWT